MYSIHPRPLHHTPKKQLPNQHPECTSDSTLNILTEFRTLFNKPFNLSTNHNNFKQIHNKIQSSNMTFLIHRPH